MPGVLIRAHKSPFTAPDASTVVARNLIGDNVGNLLFSYAVHRTLAVDGTEVGTARLNRATSMTAAEVEERYDHLVIPLANAFRRRFLPNLDALTALVQDLSIPVTVVGVGVQSAIRATVRVPEEVSAATKRFVGAVLDHAPSIGVRGEATAAFLHGLGFGDSEVEIIGCPSMFLHGDTLGVQQPTRPLDPAGPIAFNLSPYLLQMAPVVADQVARYPRLDYVAQDVRTLELLLTGRTDRETTDVRLPIHADHPLLVEGRTRFPLDPTTWLALLARYPFSYGTRIHGNIAALLAGTPAYVLAHDSRTLELARYHEIPHHRIDAAAPPSTIDAVSLYEQADWTPMLRGHAERFSRYRAFLEAHRLAHVFAPGASAAAFDARVAATRYPRAVGDPEERTLVTRARGWLGRSVLTARRRAAARRA